MPTKQTRTTTAPRNIPWSAATLDDIAPGVERSIHAHRALEQLCGDWLDDAPRKWRLLHCGNSWIGWTASRSGPTLLFRDPKDAPQPGATLLPPQEDEILATGPGFCEYCDEGAVADVPLRITRRRLATGAEIDELLCAHQTAVEHWNAHELDHGLPLPTGPLRANGWIFGFGGKGSHYRTRALRPDGLVIALSMVSGWDDWGCGGPWDCTRAPMRRQDIRAAWLAEPAGR